jgi:hypothetical protein
MRDPNKIFRDALIQALDGNLTYDGSPVNVFNEQAEPGNNNTYVIISSQSSAQEPNLSGFGHQCMIMMDVITKQYHLVTKDVVDEVSEQITEILFPSVQANGLVSQSGFQINCLAVESMNYMPMRISNTKTIIKKLIRLTAKISQS